MSPKKRLTVTLDPEVLEAVRRAVADARPPMSVSEWVNKVLAEKTHDEAAEGERRAAATRELYEMLEQEISTWTPEQLQAAEAELEARTIPADCGTPQPA